MKVIPKVDRMIETLCAYNNVNTSCSKVRVLCPTCDGLKVVTQREGDPYHVHIDKECPNCKGTGIVEFEIKMWRVV